MQAVRSEIVTGLDGFEKTVGSHRPLVGRDAMEMDIAGRGITGHCAYPCLEGWLDFSALVSLMRHHLRLRSRLVICEMLSSRRMGRSLFSRLQNTV